MKRSLKVGQVAPETEASLKYPNQIVPEENGQVQDQVTKVKELEAFPCTAASTAFRHEHERESLVSSVGGKVLQSPPVYCIALI